MKEKLRLKTYKGYITMAPEAAQKFGQFEGNGVVIVSGSSLIFTLGNEVFDLQDAVLLTQPPWAGHYLDGDLLNITSQPVATIATREEAQRLLNDYMSSVGLRITFGVKTIE